MSNTYYALKRSERARQKRAEQAIADEDASAPSASSEKSYRDLQAEARDLGVKATGTREEIQAAIDAGPVDDDDDDDGDEIE